MTAAAAMAGSWCYVDVATARIQTWLARTPKLRYQRGASTALAEHTSRAVWEAHATEQDRAEGVEWNSEAGEISGVVALRFPASELSPAQLRQRAGRIAWVAAARLQAVMPGCPVGSSWGTGDTYLAAYAGDMRRRWAAGDVLVDLPAVADESVLSRPCDMCKTRAVTHDHVHILKIITHSLCDDCWTRVQAAGYQSSRSPEQLPASQAGLLTALLKRLPGPADPARFPDDFTELAAWGQTAADDAATQVALVYGDGDRVGAALRTLIAAQAASTGAVILSKQVLATVIDSATKSAIADAAAGTFTQLATADRFPPRPGSDGNSGRRYPVVVHIAGGDDVLVSVPAPSGWLFCWLLTLSFRRRIADGLRRALDNLGVGDGDPARQMLDRPVTMSAGLVFHHAAEPFSDVVVRAADQLKTAKAYGAGQGPAIAFLDVTADGQHPAGNRAWHLTDHTGPAAFVLPAAADTLTQLSRDVPASHRSRLLAHLRDTGADAGQNAADTVRRLGHGAIYAACGQAPPTRVAEDRPATLARIADDPAIRRRLRALLDVARWWPADLDSLGIAATEAFIANAIRHTTTEGWIEP